MLFASFEVDKKVQLVILKHYFSKIMFYETDKVSTETRKL